MTTALLPLEALELRLRSSCPPSLRCILGLFGDAGAVQDFLELVREYLPEHEQAIMADRDHRASRFTDLFNERYFPINTGLDEDEGMRYLNSWCPVECMGMPDEDYHDCSIFRDGRLMMFSLVAAPEYLIGDGVRVSFLEEAAGKVGKELADRIPAQGWSAEELHKALDGTKYEGLADYASYVCHDTPCQQLNYNSEDETESPNWDPEMVTEIAEEWKTYGKPAIDRMAKLTKWLEQSLQHNFGTLLDFIESRVAAPSAVLEKPKPTKLFEIFSEEDNNERILDTHLREL